MNALSTIFPNDQRVGVDSTSASLGGAEFRPLVCQKTTVTRTQLFRSGWCCFRAVVVAFG